MEERRCVTEGIWQGTGEEEVDKAKERNKKSNTKSGEERSKNF